MTVSVVIPTYNRGYIVGEAIASVLAQSYRDFELIVADDGSTDDTAGRLRELREPRLRTVLLPHSGAPAAARNAGIRAATGELVAFLDSDDTWKPDKLATDVAFLTEHPETLAVFSDLEKWDRGRHTPSFMRRTMVFSRRLAGLAPGGSLVLTRREMYLCLLQEVPILPTAFTIRRSALTRVGGFDERWKTFEDWDLFLRLSRIGRFGYVDRPLAVVRVLRDANHRLKSELGRSTIIRRLAGERASCRGDAAALRAIRAGIVHQFRMLGWQALDAGRPGRAVAAYLRGLRATWDPELLARAAAALVRAIRTPARRARRDGGALAAARHR